MKRILFILIPLVLLLALVDAHSVQAQLTNTSDGFVYKLQVPFPSAYSQSGDSISTETRGIADLVIQIFGLGLAIGGLLAMAMIVYGGFIWATSAGNASAIGQAKQRIQDSVLGLLLLGTAWVILRTINPSLLLLQEPVLDIRFDVDACPTGVADTRQGSTGADCDYSSSSGTGSANCAVLNKSQCLANSTDCDWSGSSCNQRTVVSLPGDDLQVQWPPTYTSGEKVQLKLKTQTKDAFVTKIAIDLGHRKQIVCDSGSFNPCTNRDMFQTQIMNDWPTPQAGQTAVVTVIVHSLFPGDGSIGSARTEENRVVVSIPIS